MFSIRENLKMGYMMEKVFYTMREVRSFLKEDSAKEILLKEFYIKLLMRRIPESSIEESSKITNMMVMELYLMTMERSFMKANSKREREMVKVFFTEMVLTK